MVQEVTNFGRFYDLLKNIPYTSKEELVLWFTKGRTSSLREIRMQEYNAMCSWMENYGVEKKQLPDERELKAARSTVLKQLQIMGIDTTNWSAVDSFCMNPRISGKRFCLLTKEELSSMIPKLKSIQRKNAKDGLTRFPKYMQN